MLNCDVNIGKVKRPLQIALTITTASLVKYYSGEIKKLNKESKPEIMRMLNCDVNIGKVKRPLQIALTITTASLVKYYSGEIKKLSLPIMT